MCSRHIVAGTQSSTLRVYDARMFQCVHIAEALADLVKTIVVVGDEHVPSIHEFRSFIACS
jgi:hypothetical protein